MSARSRAALASRVPTADPRRRPIARCSPSDRVRFVGEPVALVVAETRGAALEAAEAVAVDYHERPVVTDPIAAMQPGAPAVWDDVPDNIGFLWKRGDADAHRTGAARCGACDKAAILRVARHRQFDGAARRLGRDRRGRAAGAARLASSRRTRCATDWRRTISNWNRRKFACCPAMSAARSA